jgi:hypothetical protein
MKKKKKKKDTDWGGMFWFELGMERTENGKLGIVKHIKY